VSEFFSCVAFKAARFCMARLSQKEMTAEITRFSRERLLVKSRFATISGWDNLLPVDLWGLLLGLRPRRSRMTPTLIFRAA
jgi:hypothetical protein